MGGGSRVRILVIDDDELVRGTISIMLEGAGYDVALAANGQEGLRRFADEAFDLVICDIFMPIMEGFETLRELLVAVATVPDARVADCDSTCNFSTPTYRGRRSPIAT